MGKLVTVKMWEDAGYFDKAAEPGDTVEEVIVNHFLNCVPPASHKEGYIQCGEPYSHADDKRTGKSRPTFATFHKVNGEWTYCGNCFKGEKENVSGPYDPWGD